MPVAAVPDVKLRHIAAPHKEAAPAVAVLATTQLHTAGAAAGDAEPQAGVQLLSPYSQFQP